MKTSASYLLALGLALVVTDVSAQAKSSAKNAKPSGKGCATISGTISGTVTSPAGSSQTTVVGTVSGTLEGAVSATVTLLEPQQDGSVNLKLNHSFVTREGFVLQTADTAKLTPVAGMKNVYQQTTEYKVTGGTGRYAAAKGTFTNHGETDLGKGLLTLRYEGRICGLTP
jgi:hypothetical protein